MSYVKALTLADMERIAADACGHPGCKGDHDHTRFLHPKCHMSAGTWASYTAGTGVLKIVCKKCRRVVCEIVVGTEAHVSN